MDRYAEARKRMVAALRLRLPGCPEPILAALEVVPREVYGDTGDVWEAYGDHPFPIRAGQTVSPASMVGGRVLEIGTGSGYQAAVLLELGVRLVTIERIGILYRRAARLLEDRYGDRVACVYGDGGGSGCIEGVFDGILVTAAAAELAHCWLSALAAGGRMVVPLGSGTVQRLMVFEKDSNGVIREEEILACRFVPLLSGCSGEREGK